MAVLFCGPRQASLDLCELLTARAGLGGDSLPSPPSPLRTRSSLSPELAAMYYDLNVPWTDNLRELQRTVAFLDECKKVDCFALFVAALGCG
jgi:hypothetical protein